MITPTLQRWALLLLALLVMLASGLTAWSLRRGGTPEAGPEPAPQLAAATPPPVVTASPNQAPASLSPPPNAGAQAPVSTVAAASATNDPESAPEVSTEVSTETSDASPVEAFPSASIADLPFIETVAGEFGTLNPLLTTSAATRALAEKLYLDFVGQNAQSGLVEATGLAEAWVVADSSDLFTFTLRSDVAWSDGTPVSATDVAFTFGALADAGVDSPYRATLAAVARVEALDNRTVVVTLNQPDCSALHALHQPVLPSHRYAADFSDFTASPLNAAPTTSAGPFRFVEERADGTVVLAGNPTFWRDEPAIDTYHIVAGDEPDPSTDLARLSSLPSSTVNGTVQTTFPDDRYSFIALNLADPGQPVAGLDGNNARQAQPAHPILGDVRVRQAIAAALDYDALLASAYDGATYRTGAYVPPAAAWAHDAALAPYAYDPARAAQLLDEAGWRDENSDGVRTRDGAPLQLTLLTNNDSIPRMAIAELTAQQLAAVGFDVRRSALPFEAMSEQILAQTFDLAVLSWDNLGADPGAMPFWHARQDEPGRGFNFVSFQDAEVDQWLDEARTMAGCDPDARATLYRQVQARIHDAVPYVIIGGPMAAWQHSTAWTGITPGPWGADDNIEQWSRQQ